MPLLAGAPVWQSLPMARYPYQGTCSRALVQRTARVKKWVMVFGFSYSFTLDLPYFYLILEIRKY